MKKLVFVFATVFAMTLTSCFENKPAATGNDKDSTEQVQPGVDVTNSAAAPEVAPEEASKDANQETQQATQQVAQKETPEAENKPAETPQK